MNVLRKCMLNSKLPNPVVNSTRGKALWNKDWMPGPYPQTPAQRAAAAKKYNLLPEEYEANPDGFGDYPKLPLISGASKDPYHNYDFPALKKDYGEPMHEWANIISEDRWDCNGPEKERVPPAKQMLWFFTAMLVFYIPFMLGDIFKVSLPHMKKHDLVDGPHYKYP